MLIPTTEERAFIVLKYGIYIVHEGGTNVLNFSNIPSRFWLDYGYADAVEDGRIFAKHEFTRQLHDFPNTVLREFITHVFNYDRTITNN